MKHYYHRRAPEYDDFYRGSGRFAERLRPLWDEELAQLERLVAALTPVRTLDVACGTGYLTRHLRGDVVGVDQSAAMLAIARKAAPQVTFVPGNALTLPFEADEFDRVFAAHFYGHLEEDERKTLLSEARRVAYELVVVDSALREDVNREEWQERVLNDGSRWSVYKRYFEPQELLEELGGGYVLHAGRWFVAVTSPRESRISVAC